MKTHAKNQSWHPVAPIMTTAQLAAAGLSQPKKPKKQTKANHIATLKEDLHATQELL